METPWESVIGMRTTTFTPELTTAKQLKRDFKINIIKIIKRFKIINSIFRIEDQAGF